MAVALEIVAPALVVLACVPIKVLLDPVVKLSPDRVPTPTLLFPEVLIKD